MEKIKINQIIKLLFLLAIVIFAIPSLVYIFKYGTILNFDTFYQVLLNDSSAKFQTIIYIILLLIITILYLILLKYHKKIFPDSKSVFQYVLVVGVLAVLILPFTSSDVYYYMGVGRLESQYGQNPYEVTMKQYIKEHPQEVEQDEMLLKCSNYWGDTTVVYGPIWTLLCKTFSAISMGNIDFALLIFKIFSLLVHLLNCYLIYKLVKKKVFVLIYGLNPFILLEALGNTHNDIYMVFFILASLYLLIRKKKLAASVVLLAIAAGIKYFSILLLPFVILYHVRKENLKVRFLKCIQYGLLFAVIVVGTYLIYIHNFNFFSGILTQQNKYAKSIYLSIYLVTNSFEVVRQIGKLALYGFMLFYSIQCIKLLTTKKLTKQLLFRKCQIIIMIFLFLLITNFQPWYIMWLFPLLMWQTPLMIKQGIGISIMSQFANSVFILLGEGYIYGTIFLCVLVFGSAIVTIMNLKIKKKEGERLG